MIPLLQRPWVPAALLLLGTVLVFGPAVFHQLIHYDDPVHLTAQPAVLGGLTLEGLRWSLTSTADNLWHPLSWWSLMAEMSLAGPEPVPRLHHLTHLLLHLATAGLAFLLLRSLGALPWAAALATALFAWHPVFAEPVSWVSARKDMLALPLMLGALLAYLRVLRGADRVACVVALAAATAALLAKPSAVVLPLLLGLVEMFARASGPALAVGRGWRPAFLRLAPFAALAAATAVVAILVQAGGSQAEGALPLGRRLLDVPARLGAYYEKALLPLGLIFEYRPPTGLRWWFLTGLGTLGSGLLLAAAWQVRATRPCWLFALGWFWACLLPVLGWFHVGSSFIADRYLAPALLGPAAAVALSLGALPRTHRLLAIVPAAAALLVLALLAHRQVGVWRSDPSLYRHAIAVDPFHSRAHANLGSYYRLVDQPGRAARHYREAIQYDPHAYIALYNLAQLERRAGRAEEAVRALERCLLANPAYYRAHWMLGRLIGEVPVDARDDPEADLHHLAEAFRLSRASEPRFVVAYLDALRARGRSEEARSVLEEALAIRPRLARDPDMQRLRRQLGPGGGGWNG